MKKLATLLVATFALSLASAAQMDMPKPGPEVKKLDIFVGSWTLDGTVKEHTMAPAGSMTELEKCEWQEGGFFLICHSDYKGTMGSGTGLSVMGYSTDEKAYTYREFNSFGEFTDSRGSVDGNTWTWTNDEKMGATTMKGKFIMKMTSSTTYDFSYDMSEDGAKWTTIMDGKATKK